MVKEHLERYGIRHFTDDTYWEWGGERLGERVGTKVNTYMNLCADGLATTEDHDSFYDFIASGNISSVVHSVKAGAIGACGSAIANLLPERGRILDVGCHTGYLTTYYAIGAPAREIVGWDRSKKAIATARKQAKKIQVANARFYCVDLLSDLPEGTFDALVSSCTLHYFDCQRSVLERLVRVMAPEARAIFVESLGTAKDWSGFLTSVQSVGLKLSHFETVYYSDMGCPGCYPLFELSLSDSVSPIGIDLNAEWKRAKKGLRRRW